MVDEKIYESKITEKQLPLIKIEHSIDMVLDCLTDVKAKSLRDGKSARWNDLLGAYMAVLLRTQGSIDGSRDYFLKKEDLEDEDVTCAKITEYLSLLQKKNIYSYGMEDFGV